MLKNLTEGFLKLIFPRNCLTCRHKIESNHPAEILCGHCLEAIESNRPPFCARCSRHLAWPDKHSLCLLCSLCSQNDYHFDRAWAATDYNDGMKRLIHLFKYGQKTSLRRPLSDLLFSFLDTYQLNLENFDTIVPVPLHPTRQRERGYNQSQLIAEQISGRFQIPLSINNLVRIRHTKNQALIGKKERWTNIGGAFKIRHSKNFKHKCVLIIDDLLTTGATASEAARMLKESGALRVDVLTVAITHEKYILASETESFY